MGGSAKGSEYERSLCRILSIWYSKNTAEDYFWRTSGSGSRATNLAAAGHDLTKYQNGDMTFIRPEGRPLLDFFSFEFKSYSGIDMHGVFHTISPERSLISFWAKCVRDAEASQRIPIMITKVNRGSSIAWVPVKLLSLLSHAGFHVCCDRALQFWVPAYEVVTKRTYPSRRRVKGRKKKAKAKKGKGTPKLEKYTFPEPQHVVGIDFSTLLEQLTNPPAMVEALGNVGFAALPVPLRKDTKPDGSTGILSPDSRGRETRVVGIEEG